MVPGTQRAATSFLATRSTMVARTSSSEMSWKYGTQFGRQPLQYHASPLHGLFVSGCSDRPLGITFKALLSLFNSFAEHGRGYPFPVFVI